VEPQGGEVTLLSPRASERTPYIRRESLCESEASASECYLPVVTGKEGYNDVAPSAVFGGPGEVFAVGANPGLDHVVLSSNPALTRTPVPHGGLYEWSAGMSPGEELPLVSLLPENEGGGPAEKGAWLGSSALGSIARGAVAADGSRVFWADGETGPLYVRDMVKHETIRLDLPSDGTGEGRGTPIFQAASGDGTLGLFIDEQRLTANSGSGELGAKRRFDLYACEIPQTEGKLECVLSDLTPRSAGGESAEVEGMLPGVSDDGSYVYVVARGVLTGGENASHEVPVSGANNLYVIHRTGVPGQGKWEEPRFITTLTNDDVSDWAGSSEDQHVGDLTSLTARVSPDGRYLAFMSDGSLTGYDNRDAVHPEHADQEVFLYDAVEERLVCASCDPTGARPTGIENSKSVDDAISSETLGPSLWIAANVPAWTRIGEKEARYQSRYLLDDGRLFFNSGDALVPQDNNGGEDVYEFEPAGVGDCSVGSVTYTVAKAGCVGLVSAGTSARESGFLDASVTGDDVFFLTSEKLIAQDTDTAVDIYDAHVCTTVLPCPTRVVSVPPCATADACRVAPVPEPSVFGAPSSATFSGEGNTLPVPAPTGSVSNRSVKLAAALRTCKKERPKRRRVRCERGARRRYRTTVASRASSSRTGSSTTVASRASSSRRGLGGLVLGGGGG
jgi:hypothetical protein